MEKYTPRKDQLEMGQGTAAEQYQTKEDTTKARISVSMTGIGVNRPNMACK